MIKYLLYTTCFCLLLLEGCADTAAPSTDQAKFAYEAAQTLLIEQDFDQWDKYYHAGAEVNGSAFALTIMQGTSKSLHHSFPDVQLQLVEQISSVDKVVTRFVLEGTHDGFFSNMKPTHKKYAFDGIRVDHFRDGRIQQTFMLLDLFGLSRELAAATGRAGS